MVRNGAVLSLFVLGIAVAVTQIALPRVATTLYPPGPTFGPGRTPRTSDDVPIIWRDFHPGERVTGVAEAVRVCAASLDRGIGKSALVVRMCEPVPYSPGRRFGFGYDSFIVRAQLPGGATLAYDMLRIDDTRSGDDRFTQGPLAENNVTVSEVRVEDFTDVVFVLARELPFGLPRITVTARYADRDFEDTVQFDPLDADFAKGEMSRVGNAPAWARPRY